MFGRLSMVAAAGLVLAGCASQPQRLPPPTTGGPQTNTPQNERGTPRPQPPSQASPRVERMPAPGTQPAPGGSSPSNQPPPRTIAQSASPAVLSLVDAADRQMQNKQAGRASASLERALDLDPRNPFLYQRLAAVRLVQGRPGQAEQFARKSNSLAGRNAYVKADNWRLIAKARSAQGNEAGARRAGARARDLEQTTQTYRQ